MWETPFNPSLIGRSNIIVYCPDETLADELMELLDSYGVTWGGGESTKEHSYWNTYQGGTCYWVEGKWVSFGSRQYAESDPDRQYDNHIKCTFYGIDTPDFDVASEGEILSFLTH